MTSLRSPIYCNLQRYIHYIYVEISEIFPILFRAMKLQMNMTCHIFLMNETDEGQHTFCPMALTR